MPIFSKKIHIPNDGSLAFNFTSIYTKDGLRYFISVVDKNYKHHYFYMKEENGSWIIVEKPELPEWIYQIQEELNKAFENH